MLVNIQIWIRAEAFEEATSEIQNIPVPYLSYAAGIRHFLFLKPSKLIFFIAQILIAKTKLEKKAILCY